MSEDKVLVPLNLVKSILANGREGFVSKADADSLRELLAQPSDGALTNEGADTHEAMMERHGAWKAGEAHGLAMANEGAEPVAQRQYRSRGEFSRWMNLSDDDELNQAIAEGFETRLLYSHPAKTSHLPIWRRITALAVPGASA